MNTWTWKVYTEPDNPSWLNGTLDAYYRIYNVTAHAIRAVLPNATLETGNFMNQALTSTASNFFTELNSQYPEIFPDIIGFSLYGKVNKQIALASQFSELMQWQTFLNSLNRSQVIINLEEGDVLVDENGLRLWDSDSTELGAAFIANVFTNCIEQGIQHYAEWEFYATNVHTPSLDAVDMFSKMVGEEVTSLQINYDWLTIYSKKTINGLATKSADNSTCHVLLYNLIPSHVYSNLVNVQLTILHMPPRVTTERVYLINKTHSNFHVDWDSFSANFTYYPYSGQGGSRYDMAMGHYFKINNKPLFTSGNGIIKANIRLIKSIRSHFNPKLRTRLIFS